MIDQTVPFPELVRGMARCVREWILPHLQDPMARTQAELLATLLDGLPDACGEAAAAAIERDNEAARAVLRDLGVASAVPAARPAPDVAALMRENAGLKDEMQALIAARRTLQDEASRALVRRLQTYFADSLRNELAGLGAGTDFASLSQRDVTDSNAGS